MRIGWGDGNPDRYRFKNGAEAQNPFKPGPRSGECEFPAPGGFFPDQTGEKSGVSRVPDFWITLFFSNFM